jgi:ion transport protein
MIVPCLCKLVPFIPEYRWHDLPPVCLCVCLVGTVDGTAPANPPHFHTGQSYQTHARAICHYNHYPAATPPRSHLPRLLPFPPPPQGVDECPKHEAKPWVAIYFIIFIVVGSFFALNLFIGVIIDSFAQMRKEQSGSAFLTEAQVRVYQGHMADV